MTNGNITTTGNITGHNISGDSISSPSISSSGHIVSKNIIYLFDCYATIYICKAVDNEPNTSSYSVSNCIAYGFYDTRYGTAILNTSYFNWNIRANANNWIHFFKIEVSGYTFYAKKYNSFAYDSQMYPNVTGYFELSENTHESKGAVSGQTTDTVKTTGSKNYWTGRLQPVNYNITYNKETYPSYQVRNTNNTLFSWSISYALLKITDLFVVTDNNPY